MTANGDPALAARLTHRGTRSYDSAALRCLAEDSFEAAHDLIESLHARMKSLGREMRHSTPEATSLVAQAAAAQAAYVQAALAMADVRERAERDADEAAAGAAN